MKIDGGKIALVAVMIAGIQTGAVSYTHLQGLVYGIRRRDDLLHGLFQKALVQERNRPFAQNREKILVQCVRLSLIHI